MKWRDVILRDYPFEMSVQEYLSEKERDLYMSVVLENGADFLEVGFGSGLSLIYLSMMRKSVVGVDSDRSVLSVFKQRLRRFNIQVPFILADATALPFRSDSFDVTYHQGLLEHFDYQDRVEMVREHLRVARKVVVDVPTSKTFGGKAPFDERLQSDLDWILEWHTNFKIELVFKRTFLSVGAVLTK